MTPKYIIIDILSQDTYYAENWKVAIAKWVTITDTNGIAAIYKVLVGPDGKEVK